MVILLVGLNHRSAPVAVRERLSLAGEALGRALSALPLATASAASQPADCEPLRAFPGAPLSEAVILSTCNRFELYAAAHDLDAAEAAVLATLNRFGTFAPDDLTHPDLQPHLYLLRAGEAVHHLLRVAAGLDSMILGEPQILGQVTSALAAAAEAGVVGPVLTQLFMQAIHAGKRARTETVISRHTTSVGHVAAQLLQAEAPAGLGATRVLVVGSGVMAKLAAQALHQRGAAQLAVISRTYDNASALAARVGAQALGWHEFDVALDWADAVVSATGAPHPVITREDMARVVAQRAGRPLLIVDIAMPRDVEDSVAALSGVTVRNIDELQCVLDENLAQRTAAIPEVEAVLAQEERAFSEWLTARQVAPIIAELRDWATSLAHLEAEKALQRLPNAGDQERAVVELLAHRIVNKLHHEPTLRLREQAQQGNGYVYVDAVRTLFPLETATYRPNHDRRTKRAPARHGGH
jgi:glutamyl-tRNA reductase